MDIVDKLRLKFRELRLRQVSGASCPEIEGTPELLYDAAMEIHRLQGLAYSYPQKSSFAPEGTTWRQEYEDFHDRMVNMTSEDFSHWQSVMKDDNTHGTE
jgi:hypothetical protein